MTNWAPGSHISDPIAMTLQSFNASSLIQVPQLPLSLGGQYRVTNVLFWSPRFQVGRMMRERVKKPTGNFRRQDMGKGTLEDNSSGKNTKTLVTRGITELFRNHMENGTRIAKHKNMRPRK